MSKPSILSGVRLGCLVVLLLLPLRADEATGVLQDDPKDLNPVHGGSPVMVKTFASDFVPLPSWSSFHRMPTLPDKLRPFGRAPMLVTHPGSAPEAVPAKTPPLTPPPEPAVSIPRPQNTVASDPNPTLIAVSPFLQWIKDHPKDAAAEAQRQTNAYRPAVPPAPATTDPSTPYWMPPLNDADAGSTLTTGSSAAIYSTPQRN